VTEAQQTYDVVVIGGGSTGENVAARAVRGGLTAALVESELYGGECSYWACMPSKALLRPVEVAAMARRLPGVPVGPLDVPAVLARRDEFTSHLSDAGQQQWVVGAGIAALRGQGRLVGDKRVEVTGPGGAVTALRATHAVVLATGTSAFVPDLPGLGDAQPWTSREVTSMKAVPRRLVVLGGGVVSVEMAQAVKGLGAEQVVLLVRGTRLLERMEPYAGELVADGLRETGVEIRYGASAASVRRDSGGVTVVLEDGGEVTADELLVAVGRRPRTGDLGLDTVGLEPGSSVEVDDSMRVPGSDWLYAAGDVNGRALLTHMGKYQARVCGDVIVARAAGGPDDGPALRATGPVPQVVFTDPQACSVGPTEADARRAGLVVRTVSIDLGGVAGAALLADGYRGRASLLVGEGDVVLGATFVGQEVAELLHSATVAVTAGLSLQQLWHAVPSYPTVSEAWLRLLEAAGL
jgi:dihydrolipoamide dehydrogenase